MRNLLRVLLAVFTATLSRTCDLQPLPTRHKSLVPKAIICVRYMTDFMLIAQYKMHTPGSRQSMINYLEDFRNNKTVFLRFQATKAIKSAVRVATRDLRNQQRLITSEAGTSSKRKKLTQEFLVEKEQLEQDLLTEGAHYNFPKMHLISHFPDIISQFGSLGQYSAEICEASHKAFKRAYHRSKHINIVTHIIDTYTRTYSFAMRELNIAQWNLELQVIPQDIRKVLRPTPLGTHGPGGIHVFMKLQGRRGPKKVYNVKTLAKYYSLPDLQDLTKIYLIHNAFKSSLDPSADAAHFQDSGLEAFHTIEVPVPCFDHDGHIIHKVRCTRPDLFRKREQRPDWIFVRRRASSPNKIPGSLDDRVPAQLNALFKLRDPTADHTYRLAHISLLKIIGSQTPDVLQGMSRVGCPMTNHVIRITDIEAMAHLIAIEPDQLWLVNNPIDQQTWNEIHDGN